MDCCNAECVYEMSGLHQAGRMVTAMDDQLKNQNEPNNRKLKFNYNNHQFLAESKLDGYINVERITN